MIKGKYCADAQLPIGALTGNASQQKKSKYHLQSCDKVWCGHYEIILSAAWWVGLSCRFGFAVCQFPVMGEYILGHCS